MCPNIILIMYLQKFLYICPTAELSTQHDNISPSVAFLVTHIQNVLLWNEAKELR